MHFDAFPMPWTYGDNYVSHTGSSPGGGGCLAVYCWRYWCLVLCYQHAWYLLFRSSACPVLLCLMQLSLSEDLGFCSLFYLGYIHIALRDSLSGVVHSGIACLASQATDWAIVWPVIGYPLLGVHPSMSIIRLIVIGYHCNHLDGQLNYWASAHWLIGGLSCIYYVMVIVS